MDDDTWVDKPLTPEELVRGSPEEVRRLRQHFKDHREFWDHLASPEGQKEFNDELLNETHESITPPWEE